MKLSRLAPLAVAAAVLSACAPARVAVKPEFWQSRGTRIGVAVAPYPKGGAHRVGAQGLLDMAINNAVAGSLEGHVRSVSLTAFEPVGDGFTQELLKRGMEAKRLPGYLDPAAFPEFEGKTGENPFDRNVSALAPKEGIDVLVLLSVRRVGTIRPYYGFIPLGPPRGFFEVMGQMVDLKTNQLLWQALIPEAQASVEAAEPWDQKPDYPNVDAAIGRAIENGKAFLLREFLPPGEGAPAAPSAATADAS
jgi:hypothetical protein